MTLSSCWGGEETGENAQLLGTPAGKLGVPGSVKKSETASKVDCSGGFSEVDAKGSFSFFHCALVGVSKDLRCFLLFPLRTVVIPPSFYIKEIDHWMLLSR